MLQRSKIVRSVINWTLRVGLGLLRQVASISQPWVAIIDHSIDVGTKEALVVLRVPLTALSEPGSAIQLGDCEATPGQQRHRRIAVRKLQAYP